jgi:hypothetical protein
LVIINLIQKIVENHSAKTKIEVDTQVNKALSGSIDTLISSLREKINSVNIGNVSQDNADIRVDHQKLAEAQQQSLQHMTDKIESSHKPSQKIVIKKSN